MNPYLFSWLGEGFPYGVSLVRMLLVARQKFVFWKVLCLTFSPFLGELEYLVVSWNCPVLFLLPAATSVSCFWNQENLLFSLNKQVVSSLVLNNIGNWAGGRQDSQMFCYKAVPDCSHQLGVFIMLWDFSVVSFENSGQWFLCYRRITRSMRAVLKIPAAFLQRENNV